MPATVICVQEKGWSMAVVMIGVDPHKGSHTAVAIGVAEEVTHLRLAAEVTPSLAKLGQGV